MGRGDRACLRQLSSRSSARPFTLNKGLRGTPVHAVFPALSPEPLIGSPQQWYRFNRGVRCGAEAQNGCQLHICDVRALVENESRAPAFPVWHLRDSLFGITLLHWKFEYVFWHFSSALLSAESCLQSKPLLHLPRPLTEVRMDWIRSACPGRRKRTLSR